MLDNQPLLLATRLPVKVRLFRCLPFILEIASDSLKGRVFEVSLADLQNKGNGEAWRKMKF